MPGPEVPKRHAAVEGGRVSFYENGAGPPLVLLHGIGSAGRSWTHQLSGLSDCFRVIAWDAPGYGDSTALPAAQQNASDYTSVLARFLDGLFHPVPVP